jgi:hypothetical protein
MYLELRKGRYLKMVEKNLKKLKAKRLRVMNGMNTGTRDMKSEKYYDRKNSKKELRKLLTE